jgi:hypothetical protein
MGERRLFSPKRSQWGGPDLVPQRHGFVSVIKQDAHLELMTGQAGKFSQPLKIHTRVRLVCSRAASDNQP